jgi:hypothetical protein
MSLILDGTNGLSDVDGTAGTPAIRGSDANTGVFFGTDIVGVSTGGSERVRVNASGNVGIGTSSPSYKLHAFSSSSTATVAKFGATNYGNLGTTYIEIGTQFDDGGSRIGSLNPSGNLGTLVFETMTGTSGVYAERARIDSSGNLLVGTTSSGGVGFTVGVDGAGRILTSNVSAVPFDVYLFKNGGTTVGKITINTSSTSYTTTSDYRLKEDVQPMTGALAKVAALKPVTYKWKVDGEDSEGFIAHELQEVCPSAVTGEKDAVDAEGNPRYQGIDTSFLVATLTAAIQEQQALITSLTARVVALEGQA